MLLGQRINFKKFEIFLSPNFQKRKKRWLSGILKVKCINQPSKYLGIELGSMNQKKNFFQPIFDKLNQRLVGWKSQLLSQGGRLTLIKSTMASLPIYTLSCFKAPKFICDKMDQAIRSF